MSYSVVSISIVQHSEPSHTYINININIYIYTHIHTHIHTHTHIYPFFSYYLPSCSIPRDWLSSPVGHHIFKVDADSEKVKKLWTGSLRMLVLISPQL